MKYLTHYANRGMQTTEGEFVSFFCNYANKRFFPGKNKLIVDLGIGYGLFAKKFKRMGHQIIGVDIDDTYTERFKKEGIKFVKANMEKDRLVKIASDSVDVVVSFHTIEHISNYENYMNEIKRILKPKGIFICVTPNYIKNMKEFYNDPTHRKPYSLYGLRRLFEIYKYKIVLASPFGCRMGVSRTKLYKIFPTLMFQGKFSICVGRK